jgi:hypothetical protein
LLRLAWPSPAAASSGGSPALPFHGSTGGGLLLPYRGSTGDGLLLPCRGPFWRRARGTKAACTGPAGGERGDWATIRRGGVPGRRRKTGTGYQLGWRRRGSGAGSRRSRARELLATGGGWTTVSHPVAKPGAEGE